MADLATYQAALQKAQAAGDQEAVAYFQSKIASLQQTQNAETYMQPEETASQVAIRGMQDKFENTYGIRPPETMVAGWVSTGKGFSDAWRGIKGLMGFGEEINQADESAYQELANEFPAMTTIGEIAGESAPFLAAGPAAGLGRTLVGQGAKRVGMQGLAGAMSAPAGTAARIAGGAGIGGLEGAALTKGKGGSAGETAVGGGLGATIGGAAEVVFPRLSRAFGKIGRKLIFNNSGKVTPELAAALEREGLTIEDARPILQQIYAEYGDNATPSDVANMALFKKYGITPSRGDVTQDFAQQKMESNLVESAADDLGEPMRALRREQSDRVRRLLEQQINDLGVPERAGEQLKATLGARQKRLKSEQRQLYRQLAEESQNVDAIPLDVSGSIDFEYMDDVLVGNDSAMNAIKKRLLRFGVGDPDEIDAFIEAGNKVTPLTLQNAEQFRKRLNNLGQGDPKVGVAVGPIKRALDEQYDLALEQLEASGRASELGDIARSARQLTGQIKDEFNPQSTVGRLVSVKRNSSEPIVEASNALREIFTTGQVSKKEKMQRVLQALGKEGDAGALAINDIQSAAIQQIIDDAYNAASRTIEGERVLSGASLIRAVDKFGDENLEVLFKNNPQALKMIRDLRTIGERIQPPAGAIPKGSASVILDSLNKLGIMSISQKIPGLGIVLEGAQSLVDKKAKRKAAMEAGKAVPRWTQRELDRAKQISQTMPQMASIFGIAAIANEEEEDQ